MAITVDTIVLDHDLDWVDEFNWHATVGSSARTIDDGVEVAQSYPLTIGRPMTLQGEANRGWQQRSTVQSLIALAETVGLVFNINFKGTDYSVRFVHEASPAVSFAPVTAIDDPELHSDFWYTGTIKLKIVS